MLTGKNLPGLVHPAPAAPAQGSSLVPAAATALVLALVLVAIALVAARRQTR
jgi:hypothetical protein